MDGTHPLIFRGLNQIASNLFASCYTLKLALVSFTKAWVAIGASQKTKAFLGVLPSIRKVETVETIGRIQRGEQSREDAGQWTKDSLNMYEYPM